MTTEQLSAYLRIHPKRVHNWLKDNHVVYVLHKKAFPQLGVATRERVIDPQDVIAYLKERNPGKKITISRKYL